MTLYERYKDAETLKLLAILETSENYTTDCIEVIFSVLIERKFEVENFREEILDINRKIIIEKIQQLNLLEKEIVLHKSLLMSDEDLIALYQEELLNFMDRKKDFQASYKTRY